MGMHLMIALMTKNLIFFSAVMWTFYALFVTAEQWRWVGGAATRLLCPNGSASSALPRSHVPDVPCLMERMENE